MHVRPTSTTVRDPKRVINRADRTIESNAIAIVSGRNARPMASGP